MSNGELVPDDLTIRMVMDRLAKPDTIMGVVFDGFPRTRDQALALQYRFDETWQVHYGGDLFQD